MEMCNVQDEFRSIPDCGSDALSEETLNLFRNYAEGISLPDLEKERTVFSSGHKIRSSILSHIYYRIEMNEEFPFRGSIKKIGSCWDGSKVGQLDEVDTLFVLDPNQVTISKYFLHNVRVSYSGNEYSTGQLNTMFADAVELALEGDPPEGMEHNGFAAPEFSGVRLSGPAVTVLYRTTAQCGPIQKGTMVSLDITLAIPFNKTEFDVIMEINSKIDRIISLTDNKPMDPPRTPHLIPYAVTGTWKPTTAYIEANVLHELEGNIPLKRAHLLLKCLQRKVEQFTSVYNLFDVDPSQESKHNARHTRLATHLSNLILHGNSSNARQCMKYGYVLLTPVEREQHNELQKKNIAINSAAIKHMILYKATTKDYKSQPANEQSTLALMKAVILELTRRDSNFVQHFFRWSFPAICKFSVRENLGDNFCKMAMKLRQLYEELHNTLAKEVSCS